MSWCDKVLKNSAKYWEKYSVPSGPFMGDRGLFGGSGTIDYITMPTLGNASNFGNMSPSRYMMSACSNKSRGLFSGGMLASSPYTNGTIGLFAGGYTSYNEIDYVTIANTSNAIDFGDLTVGRSYVASCSGN